MKERSSSRCWCRCCGCERTFLSAWKSGTGSTWGWSQRRSWTLCRLPPWFCEFYSSPAMSLEKGNKTLLILILIPHIINTGNLSCFELSMWMWLGASRFSFPVGRLKCSMAEMALHLTHWERGLLSVIWSKWRRLDSQIVSDILQLSWHKSENDSTAESRWLKTLTLNTSSVFPGWLRLVMENLHENKCVYYKEDKAVKLSSL